MNLQKSSPLLLALMLITSSLAGCLGTTDDSDDGLGTVMVSTYHVQQLAEAVGGDLVDVQLLSPSNIPVHDYEPTPSDIVTLGTADLFLYHGLGLETWVDATLDSMGSSAPNAVSTHAMPDGDIALEFEAILIADLCEHLNEGPYEAVNLTAEEDEHEDHEDHEEDHHVLVVHYPDNTSVTMETEHEDLPENATGWNLTTTALTANNITWNATFGTTWGHMVTGIGGVEADASWYWALYVWDEAGDHWDVSQVGIDDVMLNETEHIAWAPSYVNHTLIAEPHHEEDDHDEHDHHEGHEHATAEETIDSPAACPADTMIHIYGLEEGEHVLEFEATGIETFDLVVLKMGGAHAHHHHDHGHDDHDDDHDDHGDDDHDDHDDHGDDDHDDHGDDDHDDHGDEGPEIHAEHVAHRLSFPEHDDHDDDDHDHNESDDDHGDETHVEHGMITLHVEAEGDYGFALPHDVTMHVLKGEGHEDHDDHDDHGDDHDDHDDHGDEEARFDPHSWLDPLAFRAQVKVVRDAMIEAFPEGEDTFTANAEAYMAELVELDQGFAALSDCSLNEVAANHDAYTYMAERYDLEFVTVHGLDPEGEPSAADIEKVVDRIDEKELTVFFIEEFTSEDAVASLIEETDGVTVMTLYTMEMAPKSVEDNYLTLMQKNLDNLKSGLGC
ncbi:MAG: zinc ABC transporter substrate-binding protein [Candidatus Poseidoniaceae archaeon]|nr:zinc ABC transporter substrate-binding protein [Candidatus Poseidoniaceae archaeon]